MILKFHAAVQRLRDDRRVAHQSSVATSTGVGGERVAGVRPLGDFSGETGTGRS